MQPKTVATRLKSKKPINPQFTAPIIAMVNAMPSINLLPIFSPPPRIGLPYMIGIMHRIKIFYCHFLLMDGDKKSRII